MAVSLISKLDAMCGPKCERCSLEEVRPNYTDPAWKVRDRVRQITRYSVGRSMQSQLHASTKRERAELLAATRASLRREITALQRVRDLEKQPAALIAKSCPGIERRRGVGQAVDADKWQQVSAAKGPEGLAAERDASLGPGTDQGPPLPCDHRAKAAHRDAALEHQPREGRELRRGADLRNVPIDAAAARHRGEMSAFPGEHKRDAAESQAGRAAGDESGRALYAKAGVNSVIAMRDRDDTAELDTLRTRNRRQQQEGKQHADRRTHGRTTGALAGVISSIVRATRSALRMRTPEFAASRAARRASLSATLAGIARCARR